MDSVDQYAKILWDYLQLRQLPVKSDIILCLCSHDKRVGDRAAQLMLDGLGDYLVFSGGLGIITKDIFARPEAELFAEVAIAKGVARDKIIIENKSSNTGENVRFTFDLLGQKKIKAETILLVQKPCMERRTYATFKKQWPDPRVVVTVTSPRLSYDEYMQEGLLPKEQVLARMVGDMQRIREYPKLGFQIEQEIPDKVWQAYESLVKLGFNKQLIASVPF